LYSSKIITGFSNKNNLACLFIVGLLSLFCPVNSIAQGQDTLISDTLVQDHSVRKAVIYSLVCPGLGQIYNKKPWKIPFIYGAGGTFMYYIVFNQMKYNKFRDALFDQKDTRESVIIDGAQYRYESLDQGRDYYRRYRDLSVAGLAAIYLLNIVDAMVDAHFFYYDISDDLSLKVQPAVIQNTGLAGPTASLGLRINIGF
jgi:Family of unknown function (DUF5683)